MFVDEVDIHVAAGHGGRGCLAFRREKFVPRGGPSGGDGGHGGSVYVVASPHINTLINFRFHPIFEAEKGQHGQGSNCTGHGGAGSPARASIPGPPLAERSSPQGTRSQRPAWTSSARILGLAAFAVGSRVDYHWCTPQRKWRSGSAPACQVGGRGFESRLPLQSLR